MSPRRVILFVMESEDHQDRGPDLLRVVVDDRERAAGLADAMARLWSPVYEGRLAVGDVEIGPRVLVERKTVSDFAISLADGRLFRQAKALADASDHPLLVLEGEDGFDATGLSPNALRGVLLKLLVGFRLPLLRTATTVETAMSLARIARQEANHLEQRGRAGDTRKTRARATLEVLGTIPGIGDEKARRLIRQFGTLRRILGASEQELEATPGVGPETARAIREAGGDGRASPAP